VDAIARELVRGDIVPDVAGFRALGHQVSNHVAQLPLGSAYLCVSMQNRREFVVAVPV